VPPGTTSPSAVVRVHASAAAEQSPVPAAAEAAYSTAGVAAAGLAPASTVPAAAASTPRARTARARAVLPRLIAAAPVTGAARLEIVVCECRVVPSLVRC